MRGSSTLVAVLLAPALAAGVPNLPRAQAQEASSFYLKDHGSVRVLRGLDSDRDFKAATLPQEIDVAPAAAPATQAEPQAAQSGSEAKLGTRQKALQQAQERGVPVIRVGEQRAPGPEVDSTRARAIERAREKGITVHGAD